MHLLKLPTAIKVLLADDHEIFREGFEVMLAKHADIDLIGHAENGVELLKQAHLLRPDVIVTDIRMPKLDGPSLMQRLKVELPHIAVLTLTNFDEENLIVEMLEAGAKGYLLKSANKHEILEAIRTVHRDKNYYCSQTQVTLAQMIARSAFNPYRKQKKIEFNPRERDVIRLLCEGMTNQEIGDKLFLSRRTIEAYRERILEKMDVKNIAGVVVFAIRYGLYRL